MPTRRRGAVLAIVALAFVLGTASVRLRAAGYAGRVLFGEVPVPGALVVATSGDRRAATATDERGVFVFADLADGPWTIRVEMLAFAPLEREVTVGPGAAASDWKLTLRPLDELAKEGSVAAAPAATVAPTAVAAPARGAAAPAASATPARAATPVAPGGDEAPDPAAAATADGLLINGSVNNAAASPVAQAAAFGNNRRQAAALYNGSVGVIFGSSLLDSPPFAFGGLTPAKPDYRNVKVVGTFGGPIKFSRVLTRDPTLFLSVQHGDDHSTTTQLGVMPTARERRGDFSGSSTAIRDPSTGLPFDGNVIPEGRISPEAASLLQYIPRPTLDATTGFNFQAPLISSSRQSLLSARVMQPRGVNDQFTGQFAYQRTRTDQTTLFGFTDNGVASGIDTSVTWMHRVSRTLSMRLRYQFTGQANEATPYFANRVNVSGEAGIAGNDQTPENWGPPSLQFSTITGLSDGLPAYSRNRTNAGGAEFYWTRGRHNLTFGGDSRWIATDVRSQLNPRGTFTFNGAATGRDVADFLLGLPATSAIAFGNVDKGFRASSFDAYLTDDFRFSPRLTMQLGARFEFDTPPTEVQGRLVNLTVAPGFTAIAPVQVSRIVSPDWSGLQPRLGFAWRPIVGSSLLVRGGYGVYRNAGIYQPIANLLAQQPPLSKTFTVATSPGRPLTLANGFNAAPSTAANTFGVDPELRVGRSQSWQLLVQRDLLGFLTLNASYLGTKGDRLLQEFLPNTYPVGAANPCPSCPSGFVYLTSNGQSTRHAGQWQLRWRLHRGLAASVQYTLAKSTDNAGAFASVNLGGAAIAQDWHDLDAEQAPSNFDQRHQVVGQVQYTTGVGRSGGGLMDGTTGRLLGGWTVTTQLTTGSGLPFTPVLLIAVPGSGVVGVLRPSYSGASLEPPSGRYLNPDAYVAPAPGQWGNVKRNSVTGPAPFTCDLGVARTFQWTRRLSFDWRIDATNVLNLETYVGVNAIAGGRQFGLPAGTSTPRRLLSTMRVRF